jgi:hypothetical protein
LKLNTSVNSDNIIYQKTNMTSFSEQLNTLRVNYENSEEHRATVDRDARIIATDYFLDKFIRKDESRALFEQNAKDAATFGKKLLQLETWSGRGPVYSNQSLSDLLDFGDLCDRMQDVFNQFYGEDEFRVFHYPIRNSRTTALTVSWDKSGFENADGIIRSNRLRAQQRLDSRDTRDTRDTRDNDVRDHHDSDRPRRREHDDSADTGRPAWIRPQHPQHPRQYENRDNREAREPRQFTPREPRENRTYDPRQPFTPREPREPRQYEPRENRQYEPRQSYTPREPRQPFTPREPREDATATPAGDAPQDTRQPLRPRRRIGGTTS